MKIAVLTYVDEEGSREHEVVADQVAEALRQKGHDSSIIAIHGNVELLTDSLRRARPDVVFNLMEMFGLDVTGEVAVAGVLEAMGIPYTGGGPGEYYLAQDKALTKKILAYEGISYPRFAIFGNDAGLETGGNLRMPLFVKPLRMDASIGIDHKALVNDAVALMKQVAIIHEQCQDSALAEEYIDGREFYVGVLGNHNPTVLPPIEVDFTGLPEGVPRVLDSRAKWETDSPEFKGTPSVLAELPDELKARLQKTALDAYRALRVRDYGRVDLRLTDTGEIYVLEVNPSCYLEQSSEFATAAAAAGIGFPDLVQKIVDLALDRSRVPKPS
jgi:D-alanine-D-alanine ligase